MDKKKRTKSGYAASTNQRNEDFPAKHPGKKETRLNKIFVLLRAQTGHDFFHYKPSMINRRIERRIAVHQIETMEGYMTFLSGSKRGAP